MQHWNTCKWSILQVTNLVVRSLYLLFSTRFSINIFLMQHPNLTTREQKFPIEPAWKRRTKQPSYRPEKISVKLSVLLIIVKTKSARPSIRAVVIQWQPTDNRIHPATCKKPTSRTRDYGRRDRWRLEKIHRSRTHWMPYKNAWNHADNAENPARVCNLAAVQHIAKTRRQIMPNETMTRQWTRTWGRPRTGWWSANTNSGQVERAVDNAVQDCGKCWWKLKKKND